MIWMLFLFLAVAGTCVMLIHITLEINSLGKNINGLVDTMKEHYGIN